MAFTFVEVLFAIIILGIGMIMLAAMLPVAISQTAQTRDQIAGKSAVEAGYAYIKAIAQSSGQIAFPDTAGPPVANQPAGMMQPATSIAAVTTPPGLNQYKLSRIMSSDPSVQWVPFYRRDAGSNLVRFIVIATRISSNEVVKEYSTATMEQETTIATSIADPTSDSTNGPHLCRVTIYDALSTSHPGAPRDYDHIVLTKMSGTDPPEMAAPGTYVIIREQNNLPAADVQATYRNNGRIFKLLSKTYENPANPIEAATWNLDPEFELPSASTGPDNVIGTPDDVPDTTMDVTGSTQATAWIIGRAAIDPTSGGTNPPYSGVTQDIGILKFDLTLE